jgi:hypothetical protein
MSAERLEAGKNEPRDVCSTLVSVVQDPPSLARMEGRHLDLALRVLRRAQLLGRVGEQLRELGLLTSLPAVARDQLESAMLAAEHRKRMGLWELNRIEWALRDLPLTRPIVALKGCAYVLVDTPNARGRMFADVDLMVAEADLPMVEQRLKERGWVGTELTPYDENYYRVWAHELPPLRHLERAIEVDLHHNIVMRTARLKPSSASLLAGSRAVQGGACQVLAPVDMVLHAMVHLFYGGEMDDGLRELVDIDDLVRHFGNPEFWKDFWSRAESLELSRPAYYGLRYLRRNLGTPVPADVLQASEVGCPSKVVLSSMDRWVPTALFPKHPDQPGRGAGLARFALYLRSHWVKMPPAMLAKHLAYKLYLGLMGTTRA